MKHTGDVSAVDSQELTGTVYSTAEEEQNKHWLVGGWGMYSVHVFFYMIFTEN